MKTEEIILEMIEILLQMGVDTYQKCKCMIIAGANSPESTFLFTELFARVDERRPKLLEMKGGATI